MTVEKAIRQLEPHDEIFWATGGKGNQSRPSTVIQVKKSVLNLGEGTESVVVKVVGPDNAKYEFRHTPAIGPRVVSTSGDKEYNLGQLKWIRFGVR